MTADSHKLVKPQAAPAGAVGQHYGQTPGALSRRQTLQIVAVEQNPARERRLRSGEGAQQGRLAAAVGPDQYRKRTRSGLDTDIGQHGMAAISHSQIFSSQNHIS